MENIDLSDLFTTKAEATDFLSRLTTISEMFFQTGFNLEIALSQHFGVNKKDRIMEILRTSNISIDSLPTVKDFIFVLMTKISTLPVISLAIAFEPEEQTLKALAEWFFINTHKQMLFDISVDRNVIAGARITYNGKFFDFSIRPTFERILETYMTRLNAANEKQTTPGTQPIHQQPIITPQTNPSAPIPQPVQQAIAPQPAQHSVQQQNIDNVQLRNNVNVTQNVKV